MEQDSIIEGDVLRRREGQGRGPIALGAAVSHAFVLVAPRFVGHLE